jgi:siroheme synthase-like protein
VFYPIFLNLVGQPVLVVGAGPVALRKTRGLLEAQAAVTVVAPEALPEFDALPLRRLRRHFRAPDLQGQRLVFAATNRPAVNHRIARLARDRGLFVNLADSGLEGDFILPARLHHGPYQIAVSSSGQNPRLSQQLRQEMTKLLRDFPFGMRP